MVFKKLWRRFGRKRNHDPLEVKLTRTGSYDFVILRGKLTKYSNPIGGFPLAQHVIEVTRPNYPLILDFSEVQEADCRASAFLIDVLKYRAKMGYHNPIAVYGANGQLGYHFDAAQLSLFDIFLTDSLEKAVEACGIPGD